MPKKAANVQMKISFRLKQR